MIRLSPVLSVLMVFLRLGLTSFGGPMAHLGYFREDFVARRKWLSEDGFADIVALCQFLPGPASSQVGIAIGLSRAGLAGGVAAWIGFTLPSAIALTLFAIGLSHARLAADATWVHGLKIVAVAVVAQAFWGMARSFCASRPGVAVAVTACLLVLLVPGTAGQIGAIVLGALCGWLLPPPPGHSQTCPIDVRVPRAVAAGALGLFLLILFGLPIAERWGGGQELVLFDRFFRVGALVFGGGHVVLPLLEAAVVPPGWVGQDAFLAGYGAAQAVPGPLFTFAAFLGAAMGPEPNGWTGAGLCLAAIFLPSFLLVIGVLPWWVALRRHGVMQSLLRGVNAAVCGLLLAALYSPVWTGAIRSSSDFAIALVAFVLLTIFRVAPWMVVVLGALAATLV